MLGRGKWQAYLPLLWPGCWEVYWWLFEPLSHPDPPLHSPAGLKERWRHVNTHIPGETNVSISATAEKHTWKRVRTCHRANPKHLHSGKPKKLEKKKPPLVWLEKSINGTGGRVDKVAAKEGGRHCLYVHIREALIGGLSFLDKASAYTDRTLNEGVVFNLYRGCPWTFHIPSAPHPITQRGVPSCQNSDAFDRDIRERKCGRGGNNQAGDWIVG